MHKSHIYILRKTREISCYVAHPKWGYGPDCEAMVCSGLLTMHIIPGFSGVMNTYHVTKSGLDALEKHEQNKIIKYDAKTKS